MKSIRTLIVLAVIALSALVFGQNDPPAIKLTFPASAKPGATVKGVVELTFAEGLHAYQNPPTDKYQIPVAVSVDSKLYKLTAKYPKGISKATGGDPTPAAVYEGTIKIPVTIVVPKKAGTAQFKIVVNYQQCNDGSCFPPSSVSGVVKLKIAK